MVIFAKPRRRSSARRHRRQRRSRPVDPDSATILAGQSTREVSIAARAAGIDRRPQGAAPATGLPRSLSDRQPPRGTRLRCEHRAGAAGAGFDRWLLASTNGAIPRLDSLMANAPGKLRDYILAYGLGLSSVNDLWKKGIKLQFVDGQPEVSIPALLNAADLRWSIQLPMTCGSGRKLGVASSRCRSPPGYASSAHPWHLRNASSSTA
jgi:hypothetical protein